MSKLLSYAHVLSSRCGTLPLWGTLLVLAGIFFERAPDKAELRRGQQVELSSVKQLDDLQLIDAVLLRRAPELGMTLRRQLAQAIAEESRRANFDPLLVLAIIDVESDFEDHAVSNRGAQGLMQLKPSTLYFWAQKEGMKLTREEMSGDTSLCVRLGIRYLRSLRDKFKDLDLALMAYNAGPTRIRQARREGELDHFRIYPKLVRRDFRRFRVGVGLDGDWALASR